MILTNKMEFAETIIPNELSQYQNLYNAANNKKTKTNLFVKSLNTQAEITLNNNIIITHQTLFILDVTGSMQNIIDSVKREIVPVMEKLKNEATNAVNSIANSNGVKFVLNFEVALIGYRDFVDRVHFETHDFTSNILEIETFLSNLIANGGGDEPEDIKGAFIHALFGISDISHKLSWKNNIASKSIYLLTDSPAHGKSFHSLQFLGDNYISDCENEWNFIFKTMKKSEISFNVIKLNEKTTKMCSTFRKICNDNKVQYVEIDISQQITKENDYIGCELSGDKKNTKFHEISTLDGNAFTSMTSIFRETSEGYAISQIIPPPNSPKTESVDM